MPEAAYEVRISDWSSDVCSSDREAVSGDAFALALAPAGQVRDQQPAATTQAFGDAVPVLLAAGEAVQHHQHRRIGVARAAFGVDPADAVDIDRAARESQRHPFARELGADERVGVTPRSEEPTSELQSLMRN